MDMKPHVRFHLDLSPEDDKTLLRLAGELTSRMGIRVTKLQAIRLAVRKHYAELDSPTRLRTEAACAVADPASEGGYERT